MKKLIITPNPQEIEYDFCLEYTASQPCPYVVGDEVRSPVEDGRGSKTAFCGMGVVVAVTFDSREGNRVYVRQWID